MKTQEQMIEAAVIRICEAEESAADELFGTPPLIRNAFRAGVEQGYDASVAAERERIVAAIEAKLISSSLPDAYEEGFDDGLKAAIEIVKEAIPND